MVGSEKGMQEVGQEPENPVDTVRTVHEYPCKCLEKASVLITITMRTLMVVNWSSPEKEHEKTVPKTKIK